MIPVLLAAVLAAPTAGRPAADPCDQQIVTLETGLAPTRFIHVAASGSNATGNGSAAAPYATIAFAASRAVPGTAVRVHAGTYPGGGYIEGLTGTAQAPIWVGGAPGEPRPVLDGGANGLHVVRPRYLVLHDLEVRNASGNGVNCDDGGQVANPEAARHVVFRDLYIHDIGGGGNQDGLKLSGVNDFFVLGCTIERTGGAGSGSGVDMVGCHQGLIARSLFRQMSGHGVQAKGGSQDVEVRWCRFENAGARAVNIGGSTGLRFFRPPLSATAPNAEARDIRVVSSVFVGATAPIAFVGCVDSVVAANTIITPDNWIFRILQETVSGGGYTFLPCGGNRFENNLVYFSRAGLSTHLNIGPNTAASTFQFAHNLWYAYDNPAQSGPVLPTPELGGIVGLDPGLADPEGDLPVIWETSPAAGAGRSPAAAPADFSGRCYRDPPSIGAFEYRPSTGSRGTP